MKYTFILLSYILSATLLQASLTSEKPFNICIHFDDACGCDSQIGGESDEIPSDE